METLRKQVTAHCICIYISKVYHCVTKYNLNRAVVKVDERKEKKMYEYTKVYLLLQFVGSCQEKEREYGNWDDHVCYQKEEHIRMKKKGQAQILNFSQRLPLELTPKMGVINFRFLTSSWLVLYFTSSPDHVSPSTLQKLESFPPFRLVSKVGKSASARSKHGPPVFPSHF